MNYLSVSSIIIIILIIPFKSGFMTLQKRVKDFAAINPQLWQFEIYCG